MECLYQRWRVRAPYFRSASLREVKVKVKVKVRVRVRVIAKGDREGDREE
jgi:hypothetical protein